VPPPQHFPHTSFDDETDYLRRYFGHLGSGGSAYTLGDRFHGLQWHVYVADADGTQYIEPGRRATSNLEVTMTDLDVQQARQFFRDEKFVCAASVTRDSGIGALVPGALIDDYVFDPCGYSMNGIDGAGLITIHITPEAGFSYASVEVSGFGEGAFDPNDMVARIAAIFLPGRMSVSMSTDLASRTGAYTWGSLGAAPAGYGCQGATCQELSCGGRVSYYSMVADAAKRAADAGAKRAASPVSVLRHMPSFCSAGSALSDGSDLYMRSDSDMYTSEEECDGALAGKPGGAGGLARVEQGCTA
jgi:S-adenosylmethionine decarboxylase proenzyme